jgi:hypothetical protein
MKAKILTIPMKKPIGTSIHTLSILRINPPKFGGGLKFEPVDKSRSSGTKKLGKKRGFA